MMQYWSNKDTQGGSHSGVGRLCVMPAVLADGAVWAVGLLGLAHIAAVKQNPMMGVEAQRGGDVARERLLDLERRLATRQAYAPRHAKHVSVDGYRRLAKHGPKHYVGCLAAHTGQAGEFGHRAGHLTAEVLNEFYGQVVQVARFAVGVRHTFDVLEDIVGTGGSHGLRSGVGGKEAGGDHVDASVGALCREHNSHQQLKG